MGYDRIILIAASLALIAPAAALAQSASPQGNARVTRVSDPVAACGVMLMFSMASAHPGATYDGGRPRVSREGDVVVVTWPRLRISGQRERPTAVCRAEPAQISSLMIGGVEHLTEPQPY